MKDGLYNRALGPLPAEATRQFSGNCLLRYTRHALSEAAEDKNGPVLPPRRIFISEQSVVEVTVENGAAVKAVVREPYDVARDLVLVLRQAHEDDSCLVITLWTNWKHDQHATLKQRTQP